MIDFEGVFSKFLRNGEKTGVGFSGRGNFDKDSEKSIMRGNLR